MLKHIMLFGAGLVTGRKTASHGPKRAEPPRERVLRGGWARFFKRLAMLIVVLALGGFLLAASGIVPIKASSGHWAVTEWILKFSRARSVATHSMGISAPPLEDRALIVKGAGHYETGCRPCHGSVVGEQPRVAAAMTPSPPSLAPEIDKWDPEELFYIVKHGIKFTGMPAWPALERDDEVWAMVAFLRRLPDMDAEAYRDLVFGGPQDPAVPSDDTDTTGTTVAELHPGQSPRIVDEGGAPPLVAESCARCHGYGGEGRDVPAFPRLAGQRGEYLFQALRAYARSERPSGMMETVAAGMTEEEMRELALYFSRSTAAPGLVEDAAVPSATGDLDGGAELESALMRGREIAHRGIPARKVPSCVGCHGPASSRRIPAYPLLGGQYADYIVLQLQIFAERERGGSAYAHLMHLPTARLSDEQMEDVARYYESLGRRTP